MGPGELGSQSLYSVSTRCCGWQWLKYFPPIHATLHQSAGLHYRTRICELESANSNLRTRYLRVFDSEYHVVWFLPLLVLACIGPWGHASASVDAGDGSLARTGRGAGASREAVYASRLFLVVLLFYLSYLLYIGGDRFEFRFLVVVFPYFYWLVVEGTTRLAFARPIGSLPALAPRVLAALVGLALLGTTAWGAVHEAPKHKRGGIAFLGGIRVFAEKRVEQGRYLRERIERGELPRELVMAVKGAGALPYYTRWPTVDRLGLNDAAIVRMPVERRRLVAHEHDAPFEYLEDRGVVVMDMFNGLLFKQLSPLGNRLKSIHDGRPVPMRAIALGDRYMIFGTFVSDEELARIFAPHAIITDLHSAAVPDRAPRRCGFPILLRSGVEAECLHVDHVQQLVTPDVPSHVLLEEIEDVVDVSIDGDRRVCRDEQVRCVPQWAVCGQWLLLEYVEYRRAELPALERLHHGSSSTSEPRATFTRTAPERIEASASAPIMRWVCFVAGAATMTASHFASISQSCCGAKSSSATSEVAPGR